MVTSQELTHQWVELSMNFDKLVVPLRRRRRGTLVAVFAELLGVLGVAVVLRVVEADERPLCVLPLVRRNHVTWHGNNKSVETGFNRLYLNEINRSKMVACLH